MTALHAQDRLDDALREAFAACDEPSAALTPRLQAEVRRARRAQEKRRKRRLLARRFVVLASASGVLGLAGIVTPKIQTYNMLQQASQSA